MHTAAVWFMHVENHYPAWKKALLNLTAIPHLNGQVTQFPKILKSKQVLKRSQVKSGIDSIDLQMQSLLSVLHGYIISNPTVHMNYQHNNTKLGDVKLWILKLMSSKVQNNELKIVSRVLQPNFSACEEIWEALHFAGICRQLVNGPLIINCINLLCFAHKGKFVIWYSRWHIVYNRYECQ